MDPVPPDDFDGLQEKLAAARASVQPAPVTIEDCRQALAMLKDTSVVDRVTHIRNYEYLIALAAYALTEKDTIARLEGLVYVPGMLQCAKCKFVQISTTLNATDGSMRADNDPQQCPNGCGPLWRISERDAGNEVASRLEKICLTLIENALLEPTQLGNTYLSIWLKGKVEKHGIARALIDWQPVEPTPPAEQI